VFRISLPASPGDLEPGIETKRFSVAHRRGVLCFVASPGGRDGTLHIQSGALICSTILDTGQHLAYELAPRRSVWLHIVTGEVKMGEVGLTTGDGIGVTGEHAVSLIAQDESEILLVDSIGVQPVS
jgi:redox-sensitive bicupin YhaK (pirin superfamily)